MITFRYLGWLGFLAVCVMDLGCKDLAGTAPLPAGTVSPGIAQNVTGAMQTAVAAQIAFQTAFGEYVPDAGELADELTDLNQYRAVPLSGVPTANFYKTVQVDARILDQGTVWSEANNLQPETNTAYTDLQSARGLTLQAIGGLAAYAPDSLKVLRGQLYALLGYSEIMLADLFCSGVPLSTLDYGGDYTYQPGSTTSAVYQHAIALFDTAITLAVDSAPIVNLARVGRGRAYLGMGAYAAAGQAVANVPSTFQYVDSIVTCYSAINPCPKSTSTTGTGMAAFPLPQNTSVSDREGGVGLPFASSGDPRTADTVLGKLPSSSVSNYFPKKYPYEGIAALVLASGVEAQLITAEAELNASNASGAFAILNALRSSNPQTQGLPPLHDPGTFSAEVDTLFTERAAWLFVDGHRQGDLRRLMRQYVGQQGVTLVANQYPNGPYAGLGAYGTFIDAPIPATELANPLWTGCLSRD